MVAMIFRKRPDPVRRKEFAFVEHVSVNPLELLAVRNRQQQRGPGRTPAHVHVLATPGDDRGTIASAAESLQPFRSSGSNVATAKSGINPTIDRTYRNGQDCPKCSTS